MTAETIPSGTRRPAWIGPVLIAVIALGVGFGVGYWRGRKGGAPAAPRSLVDWHRSSFAVVPKDAVVMMTFDVGWIIDYTLDANAGLLPVRGDPGAARQALSDASRRVFGVDLLAAKRAVLWVVAEEEAVAVLLEGEFPGTLIGSSRPGGAVELPGGPTAQVTSAGLLLGTPAGVTLGAAVIAGTRPSIAQTEPIRVDHTMALESVGDGQLIVTGSLASLPLPDIFSGLRAIGASVRADGGLSACAIGAEATLARALAQVQSAKAAGKAALELALARQSERVGEARDGVGWTVLALTLAKFKYDDVVELAQLEHEGERLTLTAEGPGGFIAVYLATLANLAFVTMARFQTDALSATAQIELSKLDTHLAMYIAREGAPPVRLDALVDEQYVPARELTDHWGSPYSYERGSNGGYRLCSRGPDLLDQTSDDLCARSSERVMKQETAP